MPEPKKNINVADINEQDIREALEELTSNGAIQHVGEEFTAENTVNQAMNAWTELCQVIEDLLNGNVEVSFHNKIQRFKKCLRKWDSLVTPKAGTLAPDGLEDSCLPVECYERLDNENAITPAFLQSILDDRKKMLCIDYSQAKDNNKTLQEVADTHYKYSETLRDECNDIRTTLEELETALIASDHFFQKSSPQFKAMKDALTDAKKALKVLNYRNYTSVNGADNKQLKEFVQKHLKNVLQKTNDYLVYKQDGPTGFFGASRVKAAKTIRNRMRRLMKDYKMSEARPESEIIAGAEQNIQNLFRGDKSFIVAGYIAPEGGRHFEQFKRFADAFDEFHEEGYDVLVGPRLDLVFDQLKNPDETIGLESKIQESVGNFTDPALVPVPIQQANLFTECEGMSYTVKNMIDRAAKQKEFNVDVALYARISEKIVNGMDKNYIQQDEIIRDNIKSAKALAVTGKLYENFLPYREKAEKIQNIRIVKGAKLTEEQKAITKTVTTVEDQNRMLAYGFVKYISQQKGMGAVIRMAQRNLAKDNNWTWEGMISKMRSQEQYKDAFKELEGHFTEQVKGKVVVGHVARNYKDIMENMIPKAFEKIQKIDKEQKAEKKMNPTKKNKANSPIKAGL